MDSRAVFLSVLFVAVSAGAQTAGPSAPLPSASPVSPANLPAAAPISGSSASSPAIEPAGPAHAPNAMSVYVALRNDLPAGDSVMVKDFQMEREGANFQFDQGTFYFYAPVDGKVTGAVFVGSGKFDLSVEDANEQRSLALLTKGGPMTQEFSTLVLRFSDGTADEIRKASTGAGSAPDKKVQSTAEELAKNYRKDLSDNVELRLLADVIGGGEGGFFLASFRMGNALTGKNVLFIVDPEGAPHAAPDQVELTTWSDTEMQPWAAYTMTEPEKKRVAKRLVVTDEKIDMTFDHAGTMKGSAETTVRVLRDGVRVLRLNLYPTLRVKGVYSENGTPLDFVQEDQKLDPDFGIILPKAARAGDTLRLLTVYSGKDALRADGNQTYYLMSGARDCWYPSAVAQFGNFTKFQMTFHIPKDLQIVATGNQVSLGPDENGMVKAVWETNSPIPVAGFNLGNFKTASMKTAAGFGVDAYANVGLPDRFMPLQDSDTLGNLSTTPALKGELSQGDVAIRIYTDYFGKLPYDHVALTQQSACNFGQSWPMLVYLPICGFWDQTVQHQLGLLDYDASYWREVTPHEVSHQWWGNLVGFNSYRDQWMSEGFANFSVGVFLRNTSTRMDDFRAFWKEQQQDLLQKNAQGVRPIDAGALTQGIRVSNSKVGGDVYEELIYAKGAYVLHMLEMMYWTPADGEIPFKNSLHQFVNEYAGRAATTEEWKASMEQSMPKWLDLRGDGKLDWFFDEYVYGTELPHYAVTADFTVDDAGVTTAHIKLTQANVSKSFVMLVPLYLQLKNGETQRIANVVMHGSTTIDQNVRLGKLPSPAKQFVLNYNADVLSDN